MIDIKTRIELPVIRPEFQLRSVAAEIADDMRQHYITMMDAGKQADGSPLPLNKEGKPMGRGRGKMLRKWRLRSTKAKGGKAKAVVEPFRGGRYRHVVWMLMNGRKGSSNKGGVQLQGFDGAAQKVWLASSARVTRDALRYALPSKLQKRKLRKIKEWTG